MKNINFKSKLFLSLIAAFLTTKLLSDTVFIAGTPLIRNNLAQYLTQKILTAFTPFINNKANVISTPVAAQEDSDVLFTDPNVKKEKYTIQLSNGKNVTVIVPEGINKPPMRVLEQISQYKY